jgi:hypothetical protein
VEDAPGGGCLVSIRIPFQRYDEEEITADAHSSVA